MLEKMGEFFEARLNGYEEHQLTCIDSAHEFYPFTASCLPKNADSVSLCISVVPMWPVATDRSNRFSVSVDHGKAEVCENLFKEWGREWKIQVLENRKEFVLTLPLDTTRNDHVMTLSIVDPGQIIQKITYQ